MGKSWTPRITSDAFLSSNPQKLPVSPHGSYHVLLQCRAASECAGHSVLCACRSSAASWCCCAKTELLSLTGWVCQNLHCVSSDLKSSSASPAHTVISVETEWICQARCWCWCWMTSACRLLCGPIAFKMFLRGKAEFSASYIQQDTALWLSATQKSIGFRSIKTYISPPLYPRLLWRLHPFELIS